MKNSSLNLAIQIGNYPAIVEMLNSDKSIDFGITDDNSNNAFHLMMEKHYSKNKSSNSNSKKVQNSKRKSLSSSEILELLVHKISKCHRYLFSQYNNEMYTPFHSAIALRNVNGFLLLIKYMKANDLMTRDAIKLLVGYEEYPFVHFCSIMLKAYETDILLHEIPEIDVFQRDSNLNRIDMFEYVANNNFNNHRKWAFLKHQNKNIMTKFLKPTRSYLKLGKAEQDLSCKLIKEENKESEFHSYTDVLKKLRDNNTRTLAIRHSLRHRELKKVQNRAQIMKKDITHETKIFGDQLDCTYDIDSSFDLFAKKQTDYEEEISEDTIAGGDNCSIGHIISNMRMNPKIKIDNDNHQTKPDEGDENISTEVQNYENFNTSKKINYFSKTTFRLTRIEKEHKKSMYRINKTQRRLYDKQNNTRKRIKPNLVNFQSFTTLKASFIRCQTENNKFPLVNLEQTLKNNIQKCWNLQHIPTWDLLIDILTMIHLNK